MGDFFAPLSVLSAEPMAWPCLAFAYLLGAVPFGLLLAKQFAGVDVRRAGSFNIGATNVARVAGKKLGIATLALDALKGALPVWVAFVLPNAEQATTLAALCGFAAFMGHCFPFWLKFKGGKGVATGAGVLLAFWPWVFLIGLAAFVVVFLLSKKVSLGSLSGAFAVVVSMPLLHRVDLNMLIVGVMFAVLVLRHHSNIRRLLNKEELPVGTSS